MDIAVIIPCFNSQKTIRRAFDSILSQTLLPDEVIFIDDFSQDATIEIIYNIKIEHPKLVKVFKFNINQGAATARNYGWNSAQSEYIAFLDADDAWHPDKLKIQFEFMISNSLISISGHGHQVKYLINEPWQNLKPIDFKVLGKMTLLLSNQFCTPSVMLKREIPFRFLEKKRYAEDYLLWLQISLSNYPIAKLNLPLVATFKDNFGSSGLSSHLVKMQLGEIDCYWNLYRFNLLNLISFFVLCVFSTIKFFRRLLLTCLRKVLGQLK